MRSLPRPLPPLMLLGLGLGLAAAGCGQLLKGDDRVPLPDDDPALAELAFLSGAWTTAPAGQDRVEEHWTPGSGGSMLGVSRTIQNGRTVFFEFLRIERRDDGIFYLASPRGRGETAFRLVESGGGRAVFENPEHDFPTRILYRVAGEGRLHARIEGTQRGREASQEWSFRRAVLVGGDGGAASHATR